MRIVLRKSEYKYDNDRAPNVRLSNVKVNIVQHSPSSTNMKKFIEVLEFFKWKCLS